MRLKLIVVAILVLASAGVAFAQGIQTGVLTGTVASTDGQTLPGVLVTVKSDALIGTRTATTDAHGGYIFKALPSGVYKVTFTRDRFATVEKTVKIDLGASIPMDATLALAQVQETVNVQAEVPTPLSTSEVGANYKQSMYDNLATGRTLAAVAALAPGLTTNTPNADQVTIAGNFAFDNVFMVDGADVDDNLFGSPNAIFIEDAIDEMQVLTSGISAEYGRFGGGVINAVTKHGGNNFSGSARVNLTNPHWRAQTPYEAKNDIERKSALSKFFEGTLGGPVMKDRVWFFLAGRAEKSNTQVTLPETGLPFTGTRTQYRGEAKLSGAIAQNHHVSVTYTDVSDKNYRETFTFSIDPVHTTFNLNTPQSILVANYNGVLRPDLFIDVQYSQKKFEFLNLGGTSTAMIDSPYIAESVLAHYNAPYFDATDPEQRNNRQLAASLSYFLSSEKLGKHDIKLGFEDFLSRGTGGNSQSATSYVFYTDYLLDDAGKPVVDANGYEVPVFTPGVSQIQHWMAVRGAQVDLTTKSLYLNDKWALNRHWSFNIGARAEWAGGSATGGIQPVKASRIVPRLGLTFDPRGDGKFKLDATYSQYAGKYSQTQFANNTNVGNPDLVYYAYTGPAGQGRAFAPGIDPANYTQVLGGNFPTANVHYDPNIKSPVTKEWTGAAGVNLGNGGYVKAIYTWRKITDFVQELVTRDTGITDVVKNGIDFGTFSNRLWANTNDGLREYSALQFQAAYRPMTHLRLEGHYTLMFKNDGNQEGEATNQPGAPSAFSGFYPELFNQARTYPSGHLLGFQRHRARIWGIYDLSLGKAGEINWGLLCRLDSGSAYSIRSTGVPLTAVQTALAQQYYPDTPGTQTVFYSAGRGSEFFEGDHLFDLSANYNVPVWRKVRPWVKLEVRNIFNSTPLISYNISTKPDPNSPVDNLGLPTGYIKAKTFGTGTSTANYPNPREFLMSAGIRF
jgi:hypothetical protein